MTDFRYHERKTAALLGGKRNVLGKGFAAVDVSHASFAIECKTKRVFPAWLLAAMAQAVRSAQPSHLPLVCLHPHGGLYVQDLVVLRLGDFIDLFGDLPEEGQGNCV